MPIISNLQGNLRLNSGVFEISQGTGIVPILYSRSIVNPTSLTTGVSRYFNVDTWRFYSGVNFNLNFSSEADRQYHLQNQYWILMTGATSSGPFIQYTGRDAVQANSTGVRINFNDIRKPLFAKALVLPLDVNARIDKLINSGTFAVKTTDTLNIGQIPPYPPVKNEKLNINGNLRIQGTGFQRYINITDSGDIGAQLIVSSMYTDRMNVSLGQNNVITFSHTGFDAERPGYNYIIGAQNYLFGISPSETSLDSNSIFGISNYATGSDYLNLHGSNNLVFYTESLDQIGSRNNIRNSRDVQVLGSQNNISGLVNSSVIGLQHLVSGISTTDSLNIFGQQHSLLSDAETLSTYGNFSTLLGNSNGILASGFSLVNVIGNNNQVYTVLVKDDVNDINILGNLNDIEGFAVENNIFGSDNLIKNVTGLNNIGNSSLVSGSNNISILGFDNAQSKSSNSSVIGQNNIVFYNQNGIIVGNSNVFGNGYYDLDSSGNIVPSTTSTRKNSILVGNNNRTSTDDSISIGLSNTSVRFSGTGINNTNVLVGVLNQVSGTSNNNIFGASSTILTTGNNTSVNNTLIGNTNSIYRTSSNSLLMGNNNTISGNIGLNGDYNIGLGTNNRFLSGANYNIGLGFSNTFDNESGTLKVNLPNASLKFNSNIFDIKSIPINAFNLEITGARSGVRINLADTLNNISGLKASAYITPQSWIFDHNSVFSNNPSGTSGTNRIASVTYRLGKTPSNKVDNDEIYNPIYMPSAIEVPGCIGNNSFTGTFVTGRYDLYYFNGVNGGESVTTYGLIKPADMLNGIPYSTAINTYGFRAEGIRAQYAGPNDVINGPQYFLYAKTGVNATAIISYTSAFNPDFASSHAFSSEARRGLWALYTGHVISNFTTFYNNNNPLLINLYESGIPNHKPSRIPLYRWIGSGDWISDPVNAPLLAQITGISKLPTAPGQNPPQLKPLVDTTRMKFMSISFGSYSGSVGIPGGFIPVYY